MNAATLSTPLSQLLTRYMRGEIADPAWSRLMHLIDAGDVTAGERMAYVRFVNEVVRETGTESLFVPGRDEGIEILTDTRN